MQINEKSLKKLVCLFVLILIFASIVSYRIGYEDCKTDFKYNQPNLSKPK